MSLTTEEEQVLAGLLKRTTWPVSPVVFDALCGATIMVPIELVVIDEHDHVLMFHRKDPFFHGWHIPGTVMRMGETEEVAFQRLLKNEVSAAVSKRTFVAVVHTLKGSGDGESPRGQQAGLLYKVTLKGEYVGDGKFFPLSNPPADTLAHHKVLLRKVLETI